MTAHLDSLKLEFVKCHKLVTKYQTYSSFHVQVLETDLERVSDPSVWPEGCIISEFYGRLKNEQIVLPGTVDSDLVTKSSVTDPNINK